MTDIVDTIEGLTAKWFTEALRDGGTIGPSISVVSADCTQIGTGQLGSVVRARLEYDMPAGPSSLIVKLPSLDPGSRQLGAAMGVYEAEVRFYQEIIPLVSVEVPHMHWGAVQPETGRFTLVIDDLSPGCAVGDMVKGCSDDDARAAILELAKLHASGWDDPALLSRQWLCDVTRTQALFAAVPAAAEPFLERFGPRLDSVEAELVKRLAPKAPHYTDRVWHRPFVVTHGDYRLDNIMFGVQPGAPAVSVLDWQVTRLAPPMIDIATFLGSCVDPTQRRAIEGDILRAYHSALCAAGVANFAYEDCVEGYRRAALYPFLLTVAVSVTLERTERGDEMWARLLRGTADLIVATGGASVLD
jgi:hypothetical protein